MNQTLLLVLSLSAVIGLWLIGNETIKLDKFNVIVLFLTLIILVWYTVDNNRIANQTTESNLRPVVLRAGYIEWGKLISESPRNLIEFLNYKNIATDIKGYIVIDNKKYTLLFINEVLPPELVQMKQAGDKKQLQINGGLDSWGWLPANGRVYATFDLGKYESTILENQIYINYKDIEGNGYFSKENKKNSQSSGKI